MNGRYEIKIPISEDNFPIYKNWTLQLNRLSKIYDDRIINSIYFDCVDYSSAYDNLMGIGERSKYRIRWYGEENESECFAEIKTKKGRIGKKIVVPTRTKFSNIKIENAFSLSNSWFKNYKKFPFIPLISSKYLLPIVYVKYKRSYYLFENFIRLTFDLNPSYKLFSSKDTKDKWKIDDLCVLEIKFDPENLFKAKNFISKLPFVPKRHSKYLRSLAHCDKALYF